MNWKYSFDCLLRAVLKLLQLLYPSPFKENSPLSEALCEIEGAAITITEMVMAAEIPNLAVVMTCDLAPPMINRELSHG